MQCLISLYICNVRFNLMQNRSFTTENSFCVVGKYWTMVTYRTMLIVQYLFSTALFCSNFMLMLFMRTTYVVGSLFLRDCYCNLIKNQISWYYIYI